MAKIGNWGPYIKFETSDKRILTFNGFKRDFGIRTALHQTIGGKPLVELLGNNLQAITFTIKVRATRGMSPRKLEKKLINYMSAGVVAPLVVGRRNICSKAMITNISESFGVVLQKGELLSAQFDITMTEYR